MNTRRKPRKRFHDEYLLIILLLGTLLVAAPTYLDYNREVKAGAIPTYAQWSQVPHAHGPWRHSEKSVVLDASLHGYANFPILTLLCGLLSLALARTAHECVWVTVRWSGLLCAQMVGFFYLIGMLWLVD